MLGYGVFVLLIRLNELFMNAAFRAVHFRALCYEAR